MSNVERIFHAPDNDGLLIGANALGPEMRYPNGAVKQRSETLRFREGIYITRQKTTADYIKANNEFKIGRVKEITREQLGQIELARVAVVTRAGASEPVIPEAPSDNFEELPANGAAAQ